MAAVFGPVLWIREDRLLCDIIAEMRAGLVFATWLLVLLKVCRYASRWF